jgi:hypothetical protein
MMGVRGEEGHQRASVRADGVLRSRRGWQRWGRGRGRALAAGPAYRVAIELVLQLPLPAPALTASLPSGHTRPQQHTNQAQS